MNETSSPKIIIAIDGFSSSGKSTMAKALAKRLGYRYIDSGAMYRAVTLYAMRHGLLGDIAALVSHLDNIDINFRVNPDGSQSTLLNGEDVEREIRSMEVSAHVSDIATVGEIRRAMVKKQQALGADKGIVMDGRDITTVVFPDAELKIFVDASDETRAKRRFNELRAKGDSDTSYEQILENIRKRDFTDTHRQESPMFKAPDAVSLDNSQMSIEEQNDFLDNLVKQRLEGIRNESRR
ncbi:MAG: (d)CMP kinase [Muribaculaceae bacterium]|nr:(d)CMP kinase [Muribaculaceae bacterium]